MSKSYYEKYWREGDAPPERDPLTKKRVSIFLNFLNKKDRKNILDFGCGTGLVANEFGKNGFNVTGFDISENAINEAKKRYPNIKFIAGSVESNLPFDNGGFDIIYCAEVIEHVYDVEFLLKEFKRILKNNGVLFISTPYHGFIKNLILTLFSFDKHFNVVGAHIRFFSKKSLQSLLEKYGFKLQKVSCLGRFWPIWMDIIAILKN